MTCGDGFCCGGGACHQAPAWAFPAIVAGGGGLDDLVRAGDLDAGEDVALGEGELGGLAVGAGGGGEGAEGELAVLVFQVVPAVVSAIRIRSRASQHKRTWARWAGWRPAGGPGRAMSPLQRALPGTAGMVTRGAVVPVLPGQRADDSPRRPMASLRAGSDVRVVRGKLLVDRRACRR